MTKGERIRHLREQSGMGQVDLAIKIGVSKQLLYKYENDIVTNIPSDKVEAIAQYTHSTPAYIMGWDDTPQYDNIHPIGIQRLPVVGSVACGEPRFADEEISFYVDNTTGIPADFVLIAHGDSMTGARINDGDLVFIRKQSYVDDGDIAAVIIDDDATLKRIYHYGNLLVLRADNPAYKDIVISPEDGKTVAIMGKAVAFQSDVR